MRLKKRQDKNRRHKNSLETRQEERRRGQKQIKENKRR